MRTRDRLRGDTAGWVSEHDDHSSVVLLGIIDQVLDGKSTEQVVGELNHQGELAPSTTPGSGTGSPSGAPSGPTPLFGSFSGRSNC
jgi:hypothetical protein